MELDIAVAKINKYAKSDSGDSVEVIERPQGGVSVVLADGQSSGPGAKRISILVVRKVISLLAEGVRDGAAARAASDSLFTEKRGKVSATLNILSIDMQTQTLVITRNNPSPVYIYYSNEPTILDEESFPIGIYRNTRPNITEIELKPGLTAVIFTDGITHAGSRKGKMMNVESVISSILQSEGISSQQVADQLLRQACELDDNRPTDDISVVVLRVNSEGGDGVRRMHLTLPLKEY